MNETQKSRLVVAAALLLAALILASLLGCAPVLQPWQVPVESAVKVPASVDGCHYLLTDQGTLLYHCDLGRVHGSSIVIYPGDRNAGSTPATST